MLNIENINNKHNKNSSVGSLYSFWLQTFLSLALIIICSKINFHIGPVPFTMQTLAVILIGYFFPKKVIVSALLNYIALAFFKIPVLAGPALSVPFIYSPTFGYIIGFVIAAYFINHYKNSFKNFFEKTYSQHSQKAWFFGLAVMFCFAHIIILSCGITVLCFWTGNLFYSIKIGALPFIISDSAKILLAVSIIKFIERKA